MVDLSPELVHIVKAIFQKFGNVDLKAYVKLTAGKNSLSAPILKKHMVISQNRTHEQTSMHLILLLDRTLRMVLR